MEGFTLALALVDMIPVLSFGISFMILAGRFPSPLFMIGAVLILLAGCGKVAWKLVLGIWKKDLRWLSKPFKYLMAGGALLLVISLIIGFSKIDWAAIGAAIIGLPSVVFFAAWLVLMGVMSWYKAHRFKNDDARSNWIAQIINATGQTCLLLGILFAG